ncbi:bromodomain adjacent to zinc finger domain protein 2B-like [Lingula anatina]|uniref:Bromodomain adjacent to zinc finger domain protein 2B-like n=1 Tax=Lingula anatina TaxID=7574 RepID=A0A1S3ICT4_LINAN|nr:bromodomain adjacent to zinc finger domain protein 2B-like [Lingula anatina]|eukprot:XP_013395978.1 bromodomain adjacent to zinc finger domain protein 2B-like [Lingula anatina]
MAQRLEDITKKRKAEKQTLKEAATKAKQFRDEERRKQKEQMKLLKQQEKLQRQEQLRMEREMRAQHVVEARKRRKEELQSQRFAETLRKAKERELKRQQAVLLKEQERERQQHMMFVLNLERERRRQHMMLVKALENRRKLEEKERLKEEKKAEKRLTKQRKLEQKRLEIQMAKELKKPVEDMQLMDAKPLPTLNRIPGVKLPGPAFADCLMVVEFLHNFGNALGLDKDSIPSLNTIQMGMLNDEEELEEVLSLMTHLLKFALDDPGVPNPKEATTLLNEKITDVDLNENNISEVLRIFLVARNGSQDELTEQLKFRPYQAFNSTQKASLLGALCNELLCSKVITNEIERNIDTVSNLRRDKWVVEGKIRKMKHLQSKKFGKTSPSTSRAETTNGDSTMFNESSIFTMDNDDSSSVAPSGRSSKRGSDDEHEDGEDESGNESEGPEGEGHADAEAEHEEEEQVSQEELEKKIEKLTKQQGQYRNKVFDAAQKLRAMAFGQDRYKRRYWVLPYCGGIFVEGKESSELPTDDEKDSLKTEDQKCSLSVTENLEGNKVAENSDVKKEKGSTCKSPKIKTEMSTLPINGAVNIPDQKTQSEDKSSTNLFLQEPSTTKFSDLIQPKSEENSLKVATGSMDSKGNSSMTSPTSTPAKPGFMSIDSILKKDFVSSPSLLSSSCLTTTLSSTVNSTIDMVMKNHSVEPINQSWFSIIPRVPCDDSSIVHSPGTPKTKTSLETSHSSSFGSHSAFSPFQKLNSTPTFAGFQMGQIGNQQGYAYPGLPVFGSSPIPHSGPNSKPDTQGTSHGAIETVAGLKEVPAEALKQHSEPKPIPKELERGWWRITDPNQLKQVMRCLHMRGIRERALQKTVQKYNDYACTACSKGSKEATELEITDQDKKISQTEAGAPDPDPHDLWLPETALDLEISVLEDVESLEERIFNASLQVKGWKLPPKATEEEEVKLVSRTTIIKKDDEFYPLELAKERLVNLENNIERRYLKPPFIKSPELDMTKLTKPGNESPSSSDDSDTDDTTPALLLWRRAVTSATNPSQLMMCVLQLNKAIAWEKSIMKVSCQICHLDDNEAELLLCDSCDKGFHTYCFKPKMENIPDGDWYCYECISKASGHPHCLVCGRKNGKMAECDKCDKAYHIDCLNPPLPRLPRKYTCISCLMNKTKCKGKRGRKSKQEKELEILTEAAKAAGEKRSKEENAMDLTPCGIMLEELEDHEDGWPFLKPVNTRQFPQYRKVIKQPMDFATMRAKLEDNDYKTRQEFASDVRIIFDNCQTFNEDDSDVGQAGHNMRKYFEVRWKELCKIHS